MLMLWVGYIKTGNVAPMDFACGLSNVSLMADTAHRSIENVQLSAANRQAVIGDTVSKLVTNQRRRYLLYCLQKHEIPMTLADVADEIAIYENETDITDIAAEEIKRVYMSLYHTHIPKLTDVGLIRYSQGRDMVTLSEHTEQLSTMEETNGDHL